MAATTTLRRWIVPLSGVSLALAGVIYLVSLELSDGADARTSSSPGAELAGEFAAEGQPAPGARRAALAPPPRGRAPSSRSEGSREGASPSMDQPQRRAPLQESESTLAATSLLVQLVRGADLADRLVILDDYLSRAREAQALAELEGLVGSTLPGTFSEAEQLRLGVISRLGRLSHPRADAALIARLDRGIPRPQRLLALELLAPRESARGAISAVADHDEDEVVMEKARWAIRRGQ